MKRLNPEFRPTLRGLLLAGLVSLGSGYVVGQELVEDRAASVDVEQPATADHAVEKAPC